MSQHQSQPQRQVSRQRQLHEQSKEAFDTALRKQLSHYGYMTRPDFLSPSPLAILRATNTLKNQITDEHGEGWEQLIDELAEKYSASKTFSYAINDTMEKRPLVLHVISRFSPEIADLLEGVDGLLNKANLSMYMPPASNKIINLMRDFELLLARDWRTDEPKRGIFTIHEDIESQTTIIQLGIAEYGCLYLTLPGIIEPRKKAMQSLMTLLGRLEPFTSEVDPLAIINGSLQHVNYNAFFPNKRIIRATSGNINRLINNSKIIETREQLTPQNTIIFNSTPSTLGEFQTTFPNRRNDVAWEAWRDEAADWENSIANASFASASNVSKESVVNALSTKENVIVIVAHCDGDNIYMQDPRPNGTIVTSEYLLQHKEQISTNKPFVYLFSCEAANLTNMGNFTSSEPSEHIDMGNFASTLLECGVAGVVAPQKSVFPDDSRIFFTRIIGRHRKAPPLEDFWSAMKSESFYDMEVFLA